MCHTPDVKGTYYKCGPGVFGGYHPFDGDGVLTAYRFDGHGNVTYQSRIVETEHRKEELLHGRRLYSGAFGTPPLFRPLKNPANTNVIFWGGVLLVFCESGAPYLVNATTLETIGIMSPFHDGAPITTGMPQIDALFRRLRIFGDVVGAHPKILELESGNRLVLYKLTYGRKSTTITFYEIDESFSITKTTPVDVPGFLYLHDFVATPNHYIFMQHALQINMGNARKGIVHCLKNGSGPSFIHAVSRTDNCKNDSTALISHGFATHHAKICWDDSNKVSITSVMYPECIDFKSLQMKSCLMRTDWNIGTDVRCTQEVVHSDWVEFPSPMTRQNDAIFATSGTENVQQFLVKLSADENEAWDAGQSAFIGEPVYDHNGHVLAVVHDVKKEVSVLTVFDAANIASGPIQEYWLPEHVPTTLHGCFV